MNNKTILVTGASGFIGRHVVSFLQKSHQNYNIIAAGRDEVKLKSLGCKYIVFDLNNQPANIFEFMGRPDIMIHLAWDNLNNYKELAHLEHTLPAHIRFIKAMITGGLKNITVVGTCYEYGNIDGCLSENIRSNPEMPYSIAKDTLRRFIEVLNKQYSFAYHWTRIFFVYGESQQARTLFGQFEQAVSNGAESFNMSGGEQIRDYLHVDTLSEYLVELALDENNSGVFNICSGRHASVRNLVEGWLKERGKSMKLNLGFYPYTPYEPFAFWGDNTKILKFLKDSHASGN
jgi:dTDP-6-deoxy-L-talose 4-dehydrogenase (NAD+)